MRGPDCGPGPDRARDPGPGPVRSPCTSGAQAMHNKTSGQDPHESRTVPQPRMRGEAQWSCSRSLPAHTDPAQHTRAGLGLVQVTPPETCHRDKPPGRARPTARCHAPGAVVPVTVAVSWVAVPAVPGAAVPLPVIVPVPVRRHGAAISARQVESYSGQSHMDTATKATGVKTIRVLHKLRTMSPQKSCMGRHSGTASSHLER